MTKKTLTIRDLPRIERPREKLIKYGPDKLSNAELLAIILRTGKKGENVLKIAKNIIRRFGTKRLPDLTFKELKTIPGIGTTKGCEIIACFELSKRIFKSKKVKIAQILKPEDVFQELKDIRDLKKEHFVVFYLNSRNQEIKREIISVGTLNASLVHPREVFEPAVKNLAAQVILAHNHPSGDLEPSEDDLAINKRLVEAGKILGIEVVDHVIVIKNEYLSFKERGLL
jgi:DNA repair protein RadC